MYQVATRSREELANSVSHGFGLVFAVAAVPVLVVRATMGGGIANVIGSTVFGLALILLYAASTWYHAVPASSAKERLRLLDHAAIYMLIAGTYTPFTLGVLRGTLGWTLLGLVWTAAAVGVIAKLIVGFRYPRLSAAMYLAMGWLAVVAIRPLLLGMPRTGFALLVAGGLSYTVGVAFFAARNVPYAHFVWHLFVLAGSTCHFFAVLWYAA
jgi:hemolysin III